MSLSKYSKKVWIPDVGSKPHQPLVNFKFSYREFGKQKLVKRAFQHSWFAKWKWLHYEEDMDKALEMQLQIFATNFIMEGKKTSIKDILKYLRNISSAQRALLSEICIIALVKDRLVLYGGSRHTCDLP